MQQQRMFGIAAAAVAFLALGEARAADWTVDPSHTYVEFSLRHIVSRAHGQFKEFSGAFSFDEKTPGKTTGTFTAKAASIDTNNARRDGHLKSADFFDAEKYPDLTIVVKKMAKKGKGTYKLTADLTIRGVTKETVFDVKHLGTTGKPGARSVGFDAHARINRKDFGLMWNTVVEGGGVMLGDDVDLSLAIEANEAKAP